MCIDCWILTQPLRLFSASSPASRSYHRCALTAGSSLNLSASSPPPHRPHGAITGQTLSANPRIHGQALGHNFARTTRLIVLTIYRDKPSNQVCVDPEKLSQEVTKPAYDRQIQPCAVDCQNVLPTQLLFCLRPKLEKMPRHSPT